MTEWPLELVQRVARWLWFAYASDDDGSQPADYQYEACELLNDLREFIVLKAEMRDESRQAVGNSVRWRRFVTDWEECPRDE